jgi:CRISPR-associated endonuclease Csn1
MGFQFGFDIGTNSIGWAVFNSEKQKPVSLENLGVRIFQEGVDRTNSGAEQSKNKTRRDARGARRQHRRRNVRRRRLLKLLKQHNLAPTRLSEYDDWISLNPYDLRSEALDHKVSLYELGRALYHLNQRRGYKSNRKTKGESDGIVQQSISELAREMQKVGARTYGEYFNRFDHHDKIRGHYTLRDEYVKEFDLIWDTQLNIRDNAWPEYPRSDQTL